MFVQSDVLDVQQDMMEHFGNHSAFVSAPGYSMENLDQNKSPNNVETEREIATFNKGLPVYRYLFLRGPNK